MHKVFQLKFFGGLGNHLERQLIDSRSNNKKINDQSETRGKTVDYGIQIYCLCLESSSLLSVRLSTYTQSAHKGGLCKLCVNLSKRSNIFQWKYKKDTLVQLFKSKREALTALNPRRNHRYEALRSSLYVATKPHNTMDDCQQKNQGFGKILINSQLSFITRCSFGIENRDGKV